MSVDWKKTVHNLKCFATCNRFFECRIVVLRLFRLNIKARHEILEFLNANLWSIHLIAFDIDLPSWVEIVSLRTIFAQCSSSSSSTSEKWEVRTWNLGQIFDRVMDGWSVTQPMIVYKDKKNQSLRLDIYKLVVQSIKTFFTLELSRYRKSGSTFSRELFLKRAGRGPQRLPPTRKRPEFTIARPTRASCAGALPQELGHWFCPLNFRLFSGIAFGSDCQVTCRGSNLDSNLKLAAWPTGCRGFISSEVPKSTVWSLNSF